MEIRDYQPYNEAEVLPLYESVGWTAYTEQPDVLRRGFEHSLLVLGAFEGTRLLGLVRAVGDGETIVFIQDLLVAPDRQRTGVGTALLKAVLDRFPRVRQIELVTDDTPETRAFYQSAGLRPFSALGCEGFMR